MPTPCAIHTPENQSNPGFQVAGASLPHLACGCVPSPAPTYAHMVTVISSFFPTTDLELRTFRKSLGRLGWDCTGAVDWLEGDSLAGNGQVQEGKVAGPASGGRRPTGPAAVSGVRHSVGSCFGLRHVACSLHSLH